MGIGEVSVRNISRVKRMVEYRKTNLFWGKTAEFGVSPPAFIPKGGTNPGTNWEQNIQDQHENRTTNA